MRRGHQTTLHEWTTPFKEKIAREREGWANPGASVPKRRADLPKTCIGVTKRFQLIKSDFTNIKNYTNIEKVIGTSLKKKVCEDVQGKTDILTQPEENDVETRIKINKQNFKEGGG